MERSGRVFVVRSKLDWSDLGTWQTVKQLKGSTPDSGPNLLLGSSDVLIHRTGKRPIAVVGLSNIIVVDAPEGLLVCSGKSAQEVREVRKRLKERGMEG
jgi:mannose-1-phosphate guanylyltransferase